MTAEHDLRRFFKQVWPMVYPGLDLIRVGSQSDGGYLLHYPARGFDACFSPGVSDNSAFEKDLWETYGVVSYLADGTVDGPKNYQPKSFLRKNLGITDDETTIRLETWVESMVCRDLLESNLLLQMDIEGDEYQVFLDTPRATLIKFSEIIVEFHNIWAYGEPCYYQIARATIEKIFTDFTPIHLHGNNAAGTVALGDLILPSAFEATFLNKKILRNSIPSNTFVSLPHPLDYPNDTNRPEICLPEYWRL